MIARTAPEPSCSLALPSRVSGPISRQCPNGRTVRQTRWIGGPSGFWVISRRSMTVRRSFPRTARPIRRSTAGRLEQGGSGPRPCSFLSTTARGSWCRSGARWLCPTGWTCHRRPRARRAKAAWNGLARPPALPQRFRLHATTCHPAMPSLTRKVVGIAFLPVVAFAALARCHKPMAGCRNNPPIT